MQDPTFENTTTNFAESTMANFIDYLQTAKDKKMDGYEVLIDEFNKSNIKGDIKL